MDAELRAGSTFRERLTEDLNAVKNQMIRWLDRYFPEFTQVFPKFGKMALAALECTPFPSDLVNRQPEELLALYREVEGLKSPQRPKLIRLMLIAETSIGVTEGLEMAHIEIATLVRHYSQLEQELEYIASKLTEMVKTSVEYEWLSSVQSLGDITIVDLLAEIGSFSNYKDPRQLLKLAGLTLRENSSG